MPTDFQVLSVFMVTKGESGNRVWFRYPFTETPKTAEKEAPSPKVHRNPYALQQGNFGTQQRTSSDASSNSGTSKRLGPDMVSCLPNKVAANLFGVNKSLCDARFELTVDDVTFVGMPLNLDIDAERATYYVRYKPNHEENLPQTLNTLHVVFAVAADTPKSIKKCLQTLSMQLAAGMRYEERRTAYLEKEIKVISSAQEASTDSPFVVALEVSRLAIDLKKVYEDLNETGYVEVRVDGWSEILFCLTQKVHRNINPSLFVEPESIAKAEKALKPYHALLLLCEADDLIMELPLDYNVAVRKVIEQACPTKNFRVLTQDAALTRNFVYTVAVHLVYWGKATIIYPLCSSNQYTLSPVISNLLTPQLIQDFSETFRDDETLPEFLQTFSLPISISQIVLRSFQMQNDYQRLARMVVWCLQRHLLTQVHTYVIICIGDECRSQLPDPIEVREQERQKLIKQEDERKRKLFEQYRREGRWPKGVTPPLMSIQETWRFSFPKRFAHATDPNEILCDFTEAERSEILDIPSAQNLEDLKLFARLAPYFNGKFHKEEIMYHENVQRGVLNQIIDKFSAILFQFEHEDYSVSAFSTNPKPK